MAMAERGRAQAGRDADASTAGDLAGHGRARWRQSGRLIQRGALRRLIRRKRRRSRPDDRYWLDEAAYAEMRNLQAQPADPQRCSASPP